MKFVALEARVSLRVTWRDWSIELGDAIALTVGAMRRAAEHLAVEEASDLEMLRENGPGALLASLGRRSLAGSDPRVRRVMGDL